jgi:hypothetical protein
MIDILFYATQFVIITTCAIVVKWFYSDVNGIERILTDLMHRVDELEIKERNEQSSDKN